jgi:hypothetical protein
MPLSPRVCTCRPPANSASSSFTSLATSVLAFSSSVLFARRPVIVVPNFSRPLPLPLGGVRGGSRALPSPLPDPPKGEGEKPNSFDCQSSLAAAQQSDRSSVIRRPSSVAGHPSWVICRRSSVIVQCHICVIGGLPLSPSTAYCSQRPRRTGKHPQHRKRTKFAGRFVGRTGRWRQLQRKTPARAHPHPTHFVQPRAGGCPRRFFSVSHLDAAKRFARGRRPQNSGLRTVISGQWSVVSDQVVNDRCSVVIYRLHRYKNQVSAFTLPADHWPLITGH